MTLAPPAVNDELLRLVFRTGPVRAQLVRLCHTWRAISEQHRYPEPVAELLGQMTAAAALLASNIKFEGRLVMQIHGDGPIRLLVVECQADLALRATAKLRDADAAARGGGLQALVNPGGRARCALTLDPPADAPGQLPYQGIVALDGDSIAAALESYMRQSEQLDTRLWLAADAGTAAGLLLQRLPSEGGQAATTDPDTWDRAVALAGSLRQDELRAGPAQQIVDRLFWDEAIDLYARPTPRFACTCTRERIAQVLRSLGRAEIEAIVAEQGEVAVDCDFCNARYVFDPIDAAALFASPGPAGPVGPPH